MRDKYLLEKIVPLAGVNRFKMAKGIDARIDG